ncbi:hypothetical protein ZIOFF_060021 [Zingiber officinale]|uniref:RRM domain-containing protein n=1 Tax=Zingiber officinale TaxID=94328 RepID=A0A8J5KHC6_ZINOF|nr:hypothetical protein ZIOFF_060021 [Zingiber officinale]
MRRGRRCAMGDDQREKPPFLGVPVVVELALGSVHVVQTVQYAIVASKVIPFEKEKDKLQKLLLPGSNDLYSYKNQMSHSGKTRYAHSRYVSPSPLSSPYPHGRSVSRSLSRSRSRSRSRDSIDAENPGNNLYVTGLSSRITERELEKHFETEGKVVDAHLVVDRWTKESRGFGFVTMSTIKEADRCIKYLDRSVLEGRVITVEKVKIAFAFFFFFLFCTMGYLRYRLAVYSSSSASFKQLLYFADLIEKLCFDRQKDAEEGLRLLADIWACTPGDAIILQVIPIGLARLTTGGRLILLTTGGIDQGQGLPMIHQGEDDHTLETSVTTLQRDLFRLTIVGVMAGDMPHGAFLLGDTGEAIPEATHQGPKEIEETTLVATRQGIEDLGGAIHVATHRVYEDIGVGVHLIFRYAHSRYVSPSPLSSPYLHGRSVSRSLSRSRSRSRSRDSVDAENPGNNLYVTGLSSRITERELEKHFETEGKVVDSHLVVDRWTKESRGFGFVTMSSIKEADRCIKYLDRSVLEGRVITVEKVKIVCAFFFFLFCTMGYLRYRLAVYSSSSASFKQLLYFADLIEKLCFDRQKDAEGGLRLLADIWACTPGDANILQVIPIGLARLTTGGRLILLTTGGIDQGQGLPMIDQGEDDHTLETSVTTLQRDLFRLTIVGVTAGDMPHGAFLLGDTEEVIPEATHQGPKDIEEATRQGVEDLGGAIHVATHRVYEDIGVGVHLIVGRQGRSSYALAKATLTAVATVVASTHAEN